jgi:cation diffusion facilitator family transporter
LGSREKNKELNHNNVLNRAQLAAKQSVITLAAIGMAELVVTMFTGSTTLTADGLDSLADSMISFIVWFGINMVRKPKNNLFPLGYIKVEVLAAFTAAIIIVVLGSLITYHAIGILFHPNTIHYPEITMVALIAAGSISLHRAFLIRKVAIESNLISLKLDAKNSIKDGTASFVGFASVLIGTYTSFKFMDAVGGIIIAGYIFLMAYTAIRESTLVLIDAVDNPQMIDKIRDFVFSRFKIKTREIYLRPLGKEFIVEIHVIFPNTTSLGEVNKIIKTISEEIKNEMKLARVIIIPESEND